MTTTEFKDTATTQNDESQSTTTSTKKRGIRADVGLQQQVLDPETFNKNLVAFNERRNTPIVRMPTISGEYVDLHKLYTEVIGRGGWLKVNIKNEWEDVLTDLGFSLKCVNAVVALKQIYCRYLDKYEKFYFLGEDPDRPVEPDDDDRQSRHKKWSEKSTPIIPMSYNYLQHNVSEQTRIANKMSTDLYKSSEYEKLLLSLMSPLPNEQDFAINVCTLMANESKHTLKLENCPKLVDALIAHAGVYCHYTMRQLFVEIYTKIRKHSLESFWKDLLYKSPQILELSYEDSLQPIDENSNTICDSFKDQVNKEKEIFEDGLNADFDEDSEIENIDLDRLEFLSLGRGLGTREYIGQRIHQICTIIRNLSFFEENVSVMSKNRTFLRFLVMCSNIRWSNLHHMALDVCGNIATELDLFDPTTDHLTRCLISTLCDGIESQDRGVIISCLEILNKLSQRDTNEDYLLKCLNQKIYNQICLFLSLNDIMLLLYTLECIYGLSSLGSTPCNAFIQVKGIVDTLVSLITVEVQSYGPDGCILMRVVETVPGNMLPMVAQNIANLQNVSLAQLKQLQQSQPNLVQADSPQKATSSPQTAVQQNVNPSVISQQQTATNVAKPNLQQPTPQECEQFAISWLTATLESAPSISNRIEQQELYKLYSAALLKNGKRGSLTQIHFPRIVRSIFGTNIGPTMLKVTDSKGVETNMFFYVNLKLRANPLPLKTPQQNTQSNQNQQIQSSINVQPCTQETSNNTTNSSQSISNNQVSAAQQSANDLVNNESKEVKSNQETSSTIINQHQQQQQSQLIQQPQQKLQQQQHQQQFSVQPQQQQNILITQKQNQSQVIKPQLQQDQQFKLTEQQPQQKMIGNVIITQHTGQVVTKTTTIGQTQMTTTTHVPSSSGGSTAIIKSLLANKVTTTANNNNFSNSNYTTAPTSQNCGSNGSNMSTTCAVAKETIVSAVNTNNPNYLITQNVSLHQLAQRQNLAKQKEIANQFHGTSIQITNNGTPQKLSTTTISALVNNPIIQSTPVKVGQTTIKPINPHSLEKKISIGQVPVESMETSNWDPIPPLAPIGNTTVRSIIVPTSSLSTASEDSCHSVASNALSASHVILNDDGENSMISFDGLLVPKSKSTASSLMEDDSSKDSIMKGSQFINANKMLVNLLDKKSPDPPALTVGIKRKLIDDNKNRKKQLTITPIDEPETHVTPSKNAANLYAEMAASILEDEDIEDVVPTSKMNLMTNSTVKQTIASNFGQKQQNIQQTQQNVQNVVQKCQEPQKQIITMPLHRQIIVGPNVSHPQVIYSQNPITVQAQQQQPQTITTSSLQQATLKTDSGLQTLPVILQKQIGHGGQQILQPILQQQQQTQTQYVLATNPQGQTYLVAQQAHPQPQQTLLLTQSSGQNQQGGPTKTIIILQQQGGPPQAVAQQQIIGGGPGQPQKMIMTTPQGQQMIVTQVPRPSMQQILVNQGGNVIPQNVILTQSVIPQNSSQQHSAIQQIQQATQQTQMSPQLHIQQTMLNSQNQGQKILPCQLTANGTTLQIHQQTSHNQQSSILSQLPHIPATIKLHTPVSSASLNQKSLSQQQNITAKIINKPTTPSFSIVAQNPVTSQGNSVQSQIIQQIVKPGTNTINCHVAKVITHHQQHQQNQQNQQQHQQNQQQQQHQQNQQQQHQQNQQQQQNQQYQNQQQQNQQQQNQQQQQQQNQHQQQQHQQNQQQQQQQNQQQHQQNQQQQIQLQHQQLQKSQTIQIIQKTQSNSSQPQIIQQQKLLVQPQQNQLGKSSLVQQTSQIQNQPTVQQNLQQNMQHQKNLVQQQQQQQQNQNLQQQQSLQSATNQHQNIVQQILAQNPSQTQIIQQSPSMQGTHSPVLTTQSTSIHSTHGLQAKTNTSSLQTNSSSISCQSPSNNSNQQTNMITSSMPQNNSVAGSQQIGQNVTQQSASSSNNSNNTTTPTQRSETPTNQGRSTPNNTNLQNSGQSDPSAPPPPSPIPKTKNDEDIADTNYLYVCDWRNCPRKKYKSVQEIYKHACQVHCPDGLDAGAEIYCQWGPGPGFCDNLPRKRFSLMTHLLDRHCTLESMKAAVQRRLLMGIPQPTHANPVTIIKSSEARGLTASPALSTSSSGSAPSAVVVSAAMHAIKRHTSDFINAKELMDENEGPVTKSIRLTAALILRNLVTYTDKAKRHIRQYEPHLAAVALSNVESSRTISQILYELSN